MVRLMLVLAPIMCIVSGVAISNILRTFLPNMSSKSTSSASSYSNSNSSSYQKRSNLTSKSGKTDPTYPFKSQVSAPLLLLNYHVSVSAGILHTLVLFFFILVCFGYNSFNCDRPDDLQSTLHLGDF